MQSIALNKGSELLVLVTYLALTEISGGIDGPNVFPFYYVQLADRSSHEPLNVLRKINFSCYISPPNAEITPACRLFLAGSLFELLSDTEDGGKKNSLVHGREG